MAGDLCLKVETQFRVQEGVGNHLDLLAEGLHRLPCCDSRCVGAGLVKASLRRGQRQGRSARRRGEAGLGRGVFGDGAQVC